MRFFDFLKKITESKIEHKEIEKEKIVLSEIENWIKRKRKEFEGREKEIFILVNEKVDVFVNELEEKIQILESVDLDLKKSEDRIKSISNDGREKYIESVESFLEKLKGLEKVELKKFTEEINKIFLELDKNSNMSYERATILIGKEMANVRESLKVFSTDLIKLFDENKDIVDFSNAIFFIQSKSKQINEIEEDFKEIKKTILSLDKKISEQEKGNKKILDEIEEIKKSESYLKNSERQEKVKLLEKDLEKNILELKQLIDFKALANFFHIFEEQMNIVKIYKENFQARFKRDDGESILRLLNEAKLNNSDISEKINQIKYKQKEIKELKQEIKKNETDDLYSDVTKTILEIGNLKNEKSRNEKRRETLKINKEKIIEVIKEELRNLGVEISE